MCAQSMESGMKQGMVAGAAMQLFMRTLQATGMELKQLVSQAVATNPALEELPPLPPADDAAPGKPDFEATQRHQAFMDNLSDAQTLSGHLEQQIRTSALSKKLEAVCLLLIDHLDRHGRFVAAPQDIAQENNISASLYRQALREVRELEPAGVGAIDLQDSLILQLERKGETESLAMQLLQNHWDELVQHRYETIAHKLDIETTEVQAAARRIARLDPDPGSAFAGIEQHIITPDILVRRKGDELEVLLTGEDVPRLSLSADYRNMMAEHAEKPELRQYLSRCFREGRELIRAIDQRQQTILLVAKAIVARQKMFFFQGSKAIVPLRMEDIAQDTGLHLSTVSRAVNGKFMRCDFGVLELRHFFSAGLAAQHDGQHAASARAVQARIRQLIDAESPACPLSDADIAAALADEGIAIARRTVAKYREELRILPATQRKQA